MSRKCRAHNKPNCTTCSTRSKSPGISGAESSAMWIDDSTSYGGGSGSDCGSSSSGDSGSSSSSSCDSGSY